MFILKEGKEYTQGVAYLDDGTMVVVDNARQRIGKNVDIVVTSVLQTTAGPHDFRQGAPTPPTVRTRPVEVAPIATTQAAGRARLRRRERSAVSTGGGRSSSSFLRSRIYTIVLGTLSLIGGLFDGQRPSGRTAARRSGRGSILLDERRADRSAGQPLPPAGESCVFVANHSSIYDVPILFTALPRQLRIMAKAALGYVPFIGWHLHAQRPPAGEPQESRRGHFQAHAAHGAIGRVADRVS